MVRSNLTRSFYQAGYLLWMPAIQRFPRAVLGYVLCAVVVLASRLAEPGGAHPVVSLFAWLVVLAVLGSLVLRRERWAWFVSVIVSLAALTQWGQPNWIDFGAKALGLALLLTPEMRDWAGVRLQRVTRDPSA